MGLFNFSKKKEEPLNTSSMPDLPEISEPSSVSAPFNPEASPQFAPQNQTNSLPDLNLPDLPEISSPSENQPALGVETQPALGVETQPTPVVETQPDVETQNQENATDTDLKLDNTSSDYSQEESLQNNDSVSNDSDLDHSSDVDLSDDFDFSLDDDASPNLATSDSENLSLPEISEDSSVKISEPPAFFKEDSSYVSPFKNQEVVVGPQFVTMETYQSVMDMLHESKSDIDDLTQNTDTMLNLDSRINKKLEQLNADMTTITKKLQLMDSMLFTE